MAKLARTSVRAYAGARTEFRSDSRSGLLGLLHERQRAVPAAEGGEWRRRDRDDLLLFGKDRFRMQRGQGEAGRVLGRGREPNLRGELEGEGERGRVPAIEFEWHRPAVQLAFRPAEGVADPSGEPAACPLQQNLEPGRRTGTGAGRADGGPVLDERAIGRHIGRHDEQRQAFLPLPLGFLALHEQSIERAAIRFEANRRGTRFARQTHDDLTRTLVAQPGRLRAGEVVVPNTPAASSRDPASEPARRAPSRGPCDDRASSTAARGAAAPIRR